MVTPHRHQASHPEVTIRLAHITDVSQLKLGSKPFVLCITTSDKRKYYLSLPNTLDLRKWDHCITTRSRRGRISKPAGFQFHVHVSFDSRSQAYVVSIHLPTPIHLKTLVLTQICVTVGSS